MYRAPALVLPLRPNSRLSLKLNPKPQRTQPAHKTFPLWPLKICQPAAGELIKHFAIVFAVIHDRPSVYPPIGCHEVHLLKNNAKHTVERGAIMYSRSFGVLLGGVVWNEKTQNIVSRI